MYKLLSATLPFASISSDLREKAFPQADQEHSYERSLSTIGSRINIRFNRYWTVRPIICIKKSFYIHEDERFFFWYWKIECRVIEFFFSNKKKSFKISMWKFIVIYCREINIHNWLFYYPERSEGLYIYAIMKNIFIYQIQV